MGAYEGAGITVLVAACGVRMHRSFGELPDFWGANATGGAGAFTDGSVYLTVGQCGLHAERGHGVAMAPTTARATSVQPVAHRWRGHHQQLAGRRRRSSSTAGRTTCEVANTRISGNHGTLPGGINLGNGETPDAFINDGVECGTA